MTEYSKAVLEKNIGEKVTIEDAHKNTTTLTLTGVTSNNTGCDEWESFTATYSGDAQTPIADGCYQFQHAKLGSHQLFVSANCDNEYETVITQEKK